MEEWIYYDALTDDKLELHLVACKYASSLDEVRKAVEESEGHKNGHKYTITKTVVHTWRDENGRFIRRESVTEVIDIY